MKKVLAFAGSSSNRSINKQLVVYAASLLDGVSTEILDLNDFELPLFSIQREEELGQPELAKQFYDKIGEADLLLISLAEHNGSYSAAYKNLFDWVSRINPKVFQGRSIIYLATSPGPGGAKNVLSQACASAPHFDGNLLGQLSIPVFSENFNSDEGKISNPKINAQLEEVLSLIK